VNLLISSITTEPKETPMADLIKRGSILIKDDTFLPDALRFEREPYAGGWGFVKNLDGYGLNRKIEEAGWTFFCLAGEIKTIAFGFKGQKRIRRALKRILARLKSEEFNSLEIARVASKRFLGLPYVSVFARSRHIQESMVLFRAKDLRDWGSTKIVDRLSPVTAFRNGRESRQEAAATRLHVTTTLSL
jgi:hypothetical protein